MNTFINNNVSRKKVLVIIGAMGSGKSHLSIDLATHSQGGIINSDKMQIYKGLDIVTNKITHTEKQYVSHYLLGEIKSNTDFKAKDFCFQAIHYIEKFLKSKCVPIIVGGSNSYIEKLVEDPIFKFKNKYVSFFIWIDVALSVLLHRVHMKVDQMVNAGLVHEVRQIFVPDTDYTKGIRRSIGVLEMNQYLREEKNLDKDDELKKLILQSSIEDIKSNICTLIDHQLDKINLLIDEKMWLVHHIDATRVFDEAIKEGADEVWKNNVLKSCLQAVKNFLENDDRDIIIESA